MNFTPLETAAVTGLVSLVVALAVHTLTKRGYVSHMQCDERRRGMCQTLDAVQKGNDSLSKDIKSRTNTLFRMMRAMVVHDQHMPPDVKADILNETPGDK